MLCRQPNVGKRLLTNAEWQVAAAGTLDEVGVNCNLAASSVINTGTSSACVSNWGIVDMVGNVNEWVAEWMPGNTTTAGISQNSADYGGDSVIHVDAGSIGGNAFPAAVLRGSGFGGTGGAGVFSYSVSAQPSYSSSAIGFRCAL